MLTIEPRIIFTNFDNIRKRIIIIKKNEDAGTHSS